MNTHSIPWTAKGCRAETSQKPTAIYDMCVENVMYKSTNFIYSKRNMELVIKCIKVHYNKLCNTLYMLYLGSHAL